MPRRSVGFGKQTVDKSKIEDSLKNVFRPEFLNRIDEIIVFDSLTTEQLLEIVDLMLKDTFKALKDKNISMEISKEAKNYILEKGTNIKFGARPLRRSIQRYIEDEIAEMILKGDLGPGNRISISLDKVSNKLSFEVNKD